MFYSSVIGIVTKTEGQTDEFGFWQPGQLTVSKTISADVQPITREIASRDFGYDENVEYRIFSNPYPFKIGDLIEYEDKKYKVVKLLKWETYTDMLVDAHD